LARFDPGDQRQVDVCDEAWCFACRELVLAEEDRARASRLEVTEAWGAAQFARLADGDLFDGMEGWLTWLRAAPPLTSSLGADDLVVVVDPVRTAQRASELLDEEAELVSVLATSWGATAAPAPLHADLDKVLRAAGAEPLRVVPVPEGPSTIVSSVRPAAPLHGDPARAAQVLGALAPGTTAVVCAQTAASAAHLAGQVAREGGRAVVADAAVEGTTSVVVASLSAGFASEAARVAVWADADVTGRRTVHRPPRARSRAVTGFFDDLVVGSFVVHRHHGVARFGGVTTR
jgi:transcription-repair coupling factor (superfamily II helicase)